MKYASPYLMILSLHFRAWNNENEQDEQGMAWRVTASQELACGTDGTSPGPILRTA